MSDTPLRFGIQLGPEADRLDEVRRLARVADAEGLDLIAVQDHPYVSSQVDTLALVATILAETRTVRVFPDVAPLPIRGAGIIAKTAATLDRLSGGRFELGLGAGGHLRAINAMGGPALTPAESLVALEEGVAVIRAMWREGQTVRVTGKHVTVDGIQAGPAPAHDIGIWFGSVGPRAQAQTGRIADGWAAPIPRYLPYEQWQRAQDTIDRAAVDAGRDPAAITRIAQLVGHISPEPAASASIAQGSDPIRTDANGWARVIAELAGERRFDSFIYWPESMDITQVQRWARDVVPAVGRLLG